MKHIYDLTPGEIAEFCGQNGIAGYRSRQILQWMYRRKADGFDDFNDLPQDVRGLLKGAFRLRALDFTAAQRSALDGTIRYNFTTADGYSVQAVFLPQGGRNSVCISTQVGCPVGCYFCASGRVKFVRNLTRGEMLEQIIQVTSRSSKKISGVLLMGMGEPLLNYDNVASALSAIVNEEELGIGRRHVTVSTAGFVPQIEKLAASGAGVRLAVSLHAPDDATRKKLVPATVPYTVAEIVSAGLGYSRATGSRLTIEYILAAGVNDTLQSAQELVKLLQGHMKKNEDLQINIIACNPVDKSAFGSPSKKSVDIFRNILSRHGLVAIVRQPRGKDIRAACGQLGTYQ